ncbi:MAG: hypothetical protein K5879_03860 [Lachnospiraceae bacterium]|nr:hypothetical protein [Lachnospiraceae bacterium]
MNDYLGELTRTLLNPGYDPELFCPAPKTFISEDKKAILFIGMNPAGDKEDAKRDYATGGLFLNYYEEFDKLSKEFAKPKQKSKGLIYKTYYNPILNFFKEATGEDIAWEWCNYNFDDLLAIIKRVNNDVSDKDIRILKDCFDKYNNSACQIIVRDLVYYHQTKDFNTIIKSAEDDEVKKNIKTVFDSYIKMFPKTDMLKLIYVSTATSCKYIENVLLSSGCRPNDFGIYEYQYNGMIIPVVLAGRPLNGPGVIDKYSKRRLLGTVKTVINS